MTSCFAKDYKFTISYRHKIYRLYRHIIVGLYIEDIPGRI